MNPNNPSYFEGCQMPKIINIQRGLKKGLVKTASGKVFPVTLQNWLVEGIMLHDFVELRKSKVTGEWIVVDYYINRTVAEEIAETYEEAC